MSTPPDPLTQLNDDVLVKIFEELRPRKGLRNLSSTCRWLREASASTLFRSCCQFLGEIPWKGTNYDILSPTLWSHIRALHISCFCPPYSQRDPDVVDPLICGEFSALDAVLPALPYLMMLHLRVQYVAPHGLSLKNIKTMLSLPCLHYLEIFGLYICPELFEGDNLDDLTVTPLTTFHYTMPHYRQPWSFPSEVDTLDFLVRKLHTSLESLRLPVESAPIQTITTLHWPRLRKFTLRGERWSDPATPIISLFSSMPSLQSLALELSEPESAVAGMIWPKGFAATFPWPDLESLRVSHPDSTDEVYAHLPSSIRTLALRSWPHECELIYQREAVYLNTSRFEGYKRRWWSYPASTPGNLAKVLGQCDLPRLRHLELEYREDAREPELLQLVVTKFPHLTTLEIHRIRSEGRNDVPVGDLADALAPLTSLRTLKLHLDLAHMPVPNFGGRGISRHNPSLDDPRSFGNTLASTANEFSRKLAPSLEQIWMYTCHDDPTWDIFVVTHVVRDGEVQIGAVQKDTCRY